MHKCFIDLYEMKEQYLFDSFKTIIKCKNNYDFKSYSDLVNMKNDIGQRYHSFFKFMSDFELICLPYIRLSKYENCRIHCSLKPILRSMKAFWLFNYTIFDQVVDSLRDDPKKNNKNHIFNRMNEIFNNADKVSKDKICGNTNHMSMSEIASLLKGINVNLKNLSSALSDIDCHSLLVYECIRPFLGKTIKYRVIKKNYNVLQAIKWEL